jgi:hypothetical protein
MADMIIKVLADPSLLGGYEVYMQKVRGEASQ